MAIIRLLAWRAASLVVTCVLGAALVFLAVRLGPGDPALAALGEGASAETVAAFRARFGLDVPLPLQFAGWLIGVIHGDFGLSLTVASGVPIASLVAARLPSTLFLGSYALVIALALSLAAGSAAALTRGRPFDTLATAGAVLGISLPDFWIGYVLIAALAIGLGWFPAYGTVPIHVSLLGAIHSATLPAFAIAAPMAATFTRILRASLVEELERDHVRAARALGHTRRFVFVQHGLRNALVPYLTVIGLQVRYLLGGTVVTERIFGISGVGSLMVDAAFARDYPVVQAVTLVFLVGVVAANFLTEAASTVADPRRLP